MEYRRKRAVNTMVYLQGLSDVCTMANMKQQFNIDVIGEVHCIHVLHRLPERVAYVRFTDANSVENKENQSTIK